MSDIIKRPLWINLLLVILPAWLIVSGAGALWYYFHLERKEALVEQQRFSQSVSIPLLSDDLRKIVEVIGERNGSSELAAANLSRTASMIEGLLGPSNTGYAIKRHQSPGQWPLLQASVLGKDRAAPAIWVITSYDSPPGSRGAEANATGLSATIAAAQALANDKPTGSIHFLFLPHANDPEGPLLETVGKVLELLNATAPHNSVFYVEAMGAGESLWLSSRETSAAPLNFATGLGEIHGAEDIRLGEDPDFASILSEAGLPAVRVATRRSSTVAENDDRLPFAPTVAASTGRLIELIRRCAAAPMKEK